jgi:hypothetical protein
MIRPLAVAFWPMTRTPVRAGGRTTSVANLHQEGYWSSFVKKSGSDKKPGPPVHNDLVCSDFSASTMNQLWFTLANESHTAEGKLYVR